MKYRSLDVYLTTVLSTVVVFHIVNAKDEDMCVSEHCKEISDYAESAAADTGLIEWGLCLHPYPKFCQLTIKGNKTLVQAKAIGAAERRESIFTVRRDWVNHGSHAVRRTFRLYKSCVKNNRVDQLTRRVFDHLHSQYRLSNERVHLDRVIHFVPQVIPDSASIRQKVRNMTIEMLCFHDIDREYTHVIDRMFFEMYYSTQLEAIDGKPFIKSIVDALIRQLNDVLTTVPEQFRDTFGQLVQQISSVNVKSGFPSILQDDQLLDLMYPYEEPDQYGKLEERPPQPTWALPLSPDAAWYNLEENALYVTTLFFDQTLFHPRLPSAWNYGGMLKVVQALLRIFVRDDLIKLPDSFHHRLCSEHERIKKKGFADVYRPRALLLTALLDCFAITKLWEIEHRQSDRIPISKKIGPESFNFRIYNDMCFKKPENESDEQLYINSTASINPFYILDAEQFAKRKRNDCPVDYEPSPNARSFGALHHL